MKFVRHMCSSKSPVDNNFTFQWMVVTKISLILEIMDVYQCVDHWDRTETKCSDNASY